MFFLLLMWVCACLSIYISLSRSRVTRVWVSLLDLLQKQKPSFSFRSFPPGKSFSCLSPVSDLDRDVGRTKNAKYSNRRCSRSSARKRKRKLTFRILVYPILKLVVQFAWTLTCLLGRCLDIDMPITHNPWLFISGQSYKSSSNVVYDS